ncbi:MAG: serine/threonine protein kinase [Planctomycetes bacterium]|nr:serine/threonine protein kinase [Planctomycetota bacterium]
MAHDDDSRAFLIEDEGYAELVAKALWELEKSGPNPHRQFSDVMSKVHQIAKREGVLKPQFQRALPGEDHQRIEDLLRGHFFLEKLIIQGNGNPSSSGKDFPFYRVTGKLMTKVDPMKQESAAKSPRKGSVLHSTFQAYSLQKQLGQGGVGTVWEATDDAGAKWAIKILRTEVPKEKRKRFKNEILFSQNSPHRNIVKVVDHGVSADGAFPFYVMPIYQSSLRELMPKVSDAEKRLAYISQLLDGVEAAHLQAVVHRDLKPENVLYEERGDRIVIADFGIADFGEAELYTLIETKPNERLANFLYAAPEQRRRGEIVDQRCDIYALGLIIHEWFTGDVPQGIGFKTIGEGTPSCRWLAGVRHERTVLAASLPTRKRRSKQHRRIPWPTLANPACRMMAIAALRSVARTRGASPVLTRERSSSKVTSRT